MAMLQDGIYIKGTASFLAVVFLQARAAPAAEVGETLAELWRMYQELKDGRVRDLPGHEVPPGSLRIMVGYGTGVFELDGAGLKAPEALAAYRFPRPDPLAGAPILAGAGIHYAADVTDNPADADIAIQLTADTQLAVYRAVVETWTLLSDLATPGRPAPLRMTGFVSGFQRDDSRSWIKFHDGINNLRSDEREGVIAIKRPFDAEWATGGTYMALVRIVVDLTAWRQLSRRDQERIVGRDLLTGAPLLADRTGDPEIPETFPKAGTIYDKGNEPFREQRFPDPLPYSHINRATNHRRQYPEFATSARIFRQGFEFLEPLNAPPFFRAGLNFISFQDTPERLHTILTKDGWLGGSNFGGEPGKVPPGRWLLSALAAGLFLVPPKVDREPFPGSSVFGLPAVATVVTEEAPTGPPG